MVTATATMAILATSTAAIFARCLRTSFVDRNFATQELGPVKTFDSCISFGIIRHLYEAESLAPARLAVLRDVAGRIADPRALGRPVLVGIDGMDGAGKTTFADELAAELLREGRSVVRIGVDGFHRPRDERYRRGRHSPEGFWADSYDYDALRTQVLEPFAPGGSHPFA